MKSEVDSFFPQKGHLFDNGLMMSFNDLSLIILLIIFPQLSHTTSTIKTNDNSECDLSDVCANTLTCVKQI